MERVTGREKVDRWREPEGGRREIDRRESEERREELKKKLQMERDEK